MGGRWAWPALLLLVAAGCGRVQEEAGGPEPPPLDRESWGVRLDVVQPGSVARIEARYVAEDLGEEMARGDSGVSVVLTDSAGVEQTRITARRLLLDHRADRLSLSGEVHVAAGDSLEAWADSLVWEGATATVSFPQMVLLQLPDGHEQCRQLRAGLSLSEWSSQAVEAAWKVSARGEEVHVRALAENASRNPSLRIEYMQPEVEYAGTSVRSATARYDGGAGRLEFEGQVSASDSSLTLAAASAGVDLESRRMVARGQVRLEGSGFVVEAQEVEQVLSDSLVEARGAPAVYTQGQRRLEAPRLVYDRRAERLQAQGGVQLWDGERHLRAAEVAYERRDGRARASGGVALEAQGISGVLTAGRLSLDMDKERAELDDAPALRRVSASGDSLRVTAATMLLDLSSRTLVGRDTFVVEGPQVRLQARRGRYQDEAELLEAVEQVVLAHGQPQDDVHTLVRADSAVVYLQEGAVERVVLPGRVSGWVQSGAQSTQWVEGEAGEALFSGRDLQRFTLGKAADATHRDVERDEVSRFRGSRMDMDFGGSGKVERIVITGDAHLVARLPREGEETSMALSEVSGEQLEIRFADGRIAQVTVDKGIRGRYVPGDKREP